jgi:hypothetical protein
VDHVKPLKWVRHGIGLDEDKRIPRLRLYVHAHDFIEPGSVIAHSRAASSTEQIQ